MKRNNPTAPRATKSLGLPVSVALHVIIITAMMISLPHKLDLTQQDLPVVPVELVTVADKTNIKSMSPKADKQPDTKPMEETHDTENQPAPKPEPTPEPQPAPKPKAEPTPKPEPAPKPKAEPTPKPEPAPKPKAEPLKKEKAKPEPVEKKTAPAPEPKKPVKKKESFDLNNIMALIDKKKSKSAPSHAATRGAQTVKGFGAQDAMTADLRSMLQSQIYKCWNPPVGAPHANQLVVQFRLHLNKDGSVGQAPQLVDTGMPASNPYMRAAIDAARRAIYVCAPYKLPQNRYDLWGDVVFNFNPADMTGN